jgi:hypothetical protein
MERKEEINKREEKSVRKDKESKDMRNGWNRHFCFYLSATQLREFSVIR